MHEISYIVDHTNKISSHNSTQLSLMDTGEDTSLFVFI